MLTVKAVLQERAGRRVVLVEDPDGRRSVVKRPRRRIESEFLKSAAGRRFASLELPRVLEEGEDFLRLDFLERESHTRDSILEREWTPEDVRLWVDGLLEFQSLRLPARRFSLKQRLMGFAYPAVRAAHLGVRWRFVLPYLLARPWLRNVACHYDLQTHNYAFRVGVRRMSLLDFEFNYYTGDPLFDLLYFCSMPVVRLEEWTVQRELLREFVRRAPQRFLRARVRLILLLCHTARARYVPEHRGVYEANVALLSDPGRFRAWWSAL